MFDWFCRVVFSVFQLKQAARLIYVCEWPSISQINAGTQLGSDNVDFVPTAVEHFKTGAQ